MYFAVLGKNKVISQQELELLKPKNINIDKNIIFFDADFPERLNLLAGFPKVGRLIKFEQLWEVLANKDLVWVKNPEFGNFLKKNFNIKRFKLTDEIKTDLEIKEKWIELFNIDKENIWIVENYQNIALYEAIDFQKPVSGMQIGMMPSKLAHIMINIWLSLTWYPKDITIYDPFVWFGTTWFLANYRGFDFIGSDINITPFRQNIWRRKKTQFFKEKRIIDFKHDINLPFQKNFLKNVDIIVSEWWLWPLINYKTNLSQQQQNLEKILKVYQNFVQNVNDFYKNIVCVFTVPVYFGKNFFAVQNLKNFISTLDINFQVIDEIYIRKNQSVGRAIFILNK